MDQAQSEGVDVTIHKVKSHDTEGVNEAIDTAGNELADRYAGLGAQEHELDDQAWWLNADVDKKAFLILQRLIAITQLFLTPSGRKKEDDEVRNPPLRREPKLDKEIVELGTTPYNGVR